jgi:hypothetical protein
MIFRMIIKEKEKREKERRKKKKKKKGGKKEKKIPSRYYVLYALLCIVPYIRYNVSYYLLRYIILCYTNILITMYYCTLPHDVSECYRI